MIDRLEQLVSTGTRLPLSSRTMIDEQEFLDIIDQLRVTVPEELKQERLARFMEVQEAISAQKLQNKIGRVEMGGVHRRSAHAAGLGDVQVVEVGGLTGPARRLGHVQSQGRIRVHSALGREGCPRRARGASTS